MRHISTLCLFTSLLSLSVACTDGLQDDAPELSPTWESFRANPPVRWEAFRDTTYREPFAPYRYIVDGDIPLLDEEQLRAHYDAWLEQEFRLSGAGGSELAVRRALNADVIWPAAQRNSLTYCVSNAFGTNKAALVAALGRATAAWTARAAVGFRYVPAQDATCTAANTNVLFSVEPVTATYFASAFFPDAARAQRRLLVTPAAFTTTAGGRDLEGVMQHETGHILGFRHEHIFITCTGNSETTTDARQVTSYDVNSVMHYPQCRPSQTGGYRQSALDELGATMLYGAPRTTECLFNWAQATYPTLFTPAATTAVSGNYVFRYYSGTNAYLGIDVTDQNVYYLPAGGALQSQGPKSALLTAANCN